jgi:hypothetical protein
MTLLETFNISSQQSWLGYSLGQIIKVRLLDFTICNQSRRRWKLTESNVLAVLLGSKFIELGVLAEDRDLNCRKNFSGHLPMTW